MPSKFCVHSISPDIMLYCVTEEQNYRGGGGVVSCAVPEGERIVYLFQEGRSANFRLRCEVGQAAHIHNNPHVQCTGVYCA